MSSRDDQLLISGRLMTLNAISFVPGPNGFPQTAATVSATTCIVPATEGPFDGATAAGPATGAHRRSPRLPDPRPEHPPPPSPR